ncbi:TerC family protein [Sporomusa malonica]|uniref:Integral membrane protein, YjbE family n=1 Tax=Sporomusa malonica TaxID=112901 RepID=A0A1W2A6K5_9FIRM|nr:TerC family protein [Sporomusa malonica]SMC56369.1 integral membrane protein, YjbE family [Sporomusa malonica]
MEFFGTIGPEWFMALGSILLINLVLSGDNAVIIALASKNLPLSQRKQAIMWGSLGAVILRIILTFVAAYLLDIPYLQFAGGLALLYIAISLLKQDSTEGEYGEATSYREAIKVILFADLIMSLDNVLALAAISQTVPSGKYGLITVGLATSIPLVVFGAQILMKLMDRFPAIIYIGAGVLGYAAAEMIISDKAVGPYVSDYALFLEVGLSLAVVVAGYLMNSRSAKAPS